MEGAEVEGCWNQTIWPKGFVLALSSQVQYSRGVECRMFIAHFKEDSLEWVMVLFAHSYRVVRLYP